MAQEEKKELISQYKELYGKNPAPKWSAEEIKAKIENFELLPENEKDSKRYWGDFYIDPTKTYTFKLKGKRNPRYLLPKEAEVWCEEKQQPRKIRLCRTEDSPFVDEQSEFAKVDDTAILCFESNFGDIAVLNLSGALSNYIKYVFAYDGYDGKKNILQTNAMVKDAYELDMPEEKVKKSIATEELKLDAKFKIRQTSIGDLRVFLRSSFQSNVDSMTDEEVKNLAYVHAETTPQVFLKQLHDPIHAIRDKVLKALTSNLIIVKDSRICWADTDGTISNFNNSEKPEEILTQMLLKGDTQGKDLQKRLEQLM